MTLREELDAIADSNGGILEPKKVVQFAKDNPGSYLHSRFEWDDSKAAAVQRIEHARRLIRVYVKVTDKVVDPIRAYVSLESDRDAGGGYRRMVDIMESPTRREELLQQALKELHVWQRKYQSLTELAGVFTAAEAVSARPRQIGSEPIQPHA